MRRSLARLVLLLVPILLGGGCTSSPSSDTGRHAQFVSTLPEAAAVGDPGASPLAASRVGPDGIAGVPDYRIGAADILDISVFGVPELSKTVQVGSNGRITLPLIGEVTAVGKTTDRLRADITEKLAATYLQSPEVSVAVKDAASQRVTVSGAVKNPGIFPINSQTTLLQTIAMAQGPDQLADTSNVVVFRYTGGQRMAARFDIASIGEGVSADPVVAAGDMIIVDKSGTRSTLHDIRQHIPILSIFMPFMLL